MEIFGYHLIMKQTDIYHSIMDWCRTKRPDCEFTGRTRTDLKKWRAEFARHYRRCLGPWPRPAPLRVRILGRRKCDGFIREKVVFESTPGIHVPAYILTPAGLAKGEKRPGILAAHGHGRGKASICGVVAKGDKAHADAVKKVNYGYAVEAVLHGYVVIAPDWIPFGERKPPIWWSRPYRDACDISSMALQYFGYTLLAQNVWDGMRCVDVLCRHPNVDPRKIGVIGLSYGGTMATHLLVNDPRIRAGVVSGYISTVRHDALGPRGKGNTCGAQYVPGLLKHGDIPEVLGLAVPKPVLFEMGRREDTFHYPDMVRAYNRLARIYRAAGAGDRIAKDAHGGRHRWSGRKAWDWLSRWL